MTLKDHENRFIEQCKRDFKSLTFESEQLLRYGYSMGVDELGPVAYNAGIDTQRARVLNALGATRAQNKLPPK